MMYLRALLFAAGMMYAGLGIGMAFLFSNVGGTVLQVGIVWSSFSSSSLPLHPSRSCAMQDRSKPTRLIHVIQRTGSPRQCFHSPFSAYPLPHSSFYTGICFTPANFCRPTCAKITVITDSLTRQLSARSASVLLAVVMATIIH